MGEESRVCNSRAYLWPVFLQSRKKNYIHSVKYLTVYHVQDFVPSDGHTDSPFPLGTQQLAEETDNFAAVW